LTFAGQSQEVTLRLDADGVVTNGVLFGVPTVSWLVTSWPSDPRRADAATREPQPREFETDTRVIARPSRGRSRSGLFADVRDIL
jgi:hypothetical protein